MSNKRFTYLDFVSFDIANLSPQFISDVANFEGFSPNVYKCPSGVLTFGFGHTSSKLTTKTSLNVSLDTAKRILIDDLLRVYNILIGVFPQFNSLPECYRNMLIDLGFNCGTSYFSQSNTELHIFVEKLCSCFHRYSNSCPDYSDALLLTVLRYSHSNGRFLNGLHRRRYYYVKECILWHAKNGYAK